MKKKIIAAMMILCLAGTSAAFAGGFKHGNYGHYSRGYHSGGHHDNDLGIVLGVAGGLLVGSALLYAATSPPPPAVMYDYRPPAYPPEVIIQQPSVCFEDRVFDGEWQMNRGRQIWVSFPYPVTRRTQVPCY